MYSSTSGGNRSRILLAASMDARRHDTTPFIVISAKINSWKDVHLTVFKYLAMVHWLMLMMTLLCHQSHHD